MQTATLSGDYATASDHANEVVALAEEKGALLWKAHGTMMQGVLMGLKGKPDRAVQAIASGMKAWRSTGATVWVPFYLCHLSKAHVEVKQLDEARRCIAEAISLMGKTKETWCEAEVHRVAGEIAMTAETSAKAEAQFEHALTVARQQQAKSSELRAAMSMARLWRDEGKLDEARELVAPVYGWFTDGFDTTDLKQAKALLDELA